METIKEKFNAPVGTHSFWRKNLTIHENSNQQDNQHQEKQLQWG